MRRKIKQTVIQNQKRTFSKKDLLKQKTYKKNDMREARRLYKTLSYLLTSTTSTKKNDPITYQRYAFSQQQKCITKMRFGLTKEKHVRFLNEYLTQQKKNGITEKPELFSNAENIEEYIKDYQLKMSEKHFKFIISPESQNVDCKALVKTLVARLEKTTGYNFHWLSAIHTNTNHVHAHLLINGVDKNGKEVDCFRGVLLKQTIREMASQICTELVGPRTKEQIENSIKKLPMATRYCVLDNKIELYAVRNTDEKTKKEFPEKILAQDDIMQQRLSFLSELGFAKKDNNEKTFLLEKQWAKKLKSIGRYNSFLKARNELVFTQAADLQMFTKETAETVQGKITKIFKMNEEDSWNNAIIVEDKKSKKAYYVPVYAEPSEKLLHAEVNCTVGTNKTGVFRPIIKVIEWSSQQSK